MRINEDNYVDMAEDAIKRLSSLKNQRGFDIPMVTTSKIRNLLAMVSDIYNEVLKLSEDKLPQNIVGKINYMRIRFYYEAGREPKVKSLLEKADVFNIIKEIGNSKKNYILFSRYMEALVAFRKFYGKSDD